MSPQPLTPDIAARRITVAGRVQAVGFRPFVYRLAQAQGLAGWVFNNGGRVLIHAEGEIAKLQMFETALVAEAPPLARPVIEQSSAAQREGHAAFTIRPSLDLAASDVHLPPDLFCCDDCLREVQDKNERRYRYAFTNCTQCGPRYTLIAALPYDRRNTTMAGFALCPACKAEYDDPGNRRFHAQPLACPACGPQLLFEAPGEPQLTGDAAVAATVKLLRDGGIVAVKGVGGYHLLCDAENQNGVMRLRARKQRPHKPFAVMVPMLGEDDLDGLRRIVILDAVSAEACRDPLRPIVLMDRAPNSNICEAVAPGLAELGVFLPYSPLHHILLGDFGSPLVATSGNISGEPVITDDEEARRRLLGIADAMLCHNRAILRPADDTVQRPIAGAARTLRAGRGLAPLERDLDRAFVEPVLATGGQAKSTVALGWGRRAVVSPHIGELDTRRGLDVFRQVIADLQSLYRVEPRLIACDLHPGFAARRWAEAQGLPVLAVQHHLAHASALAGEYPDARTWLTFTWDAVGLGSDGDLWGGEAFVGSPGHWLRVASFRPFHLLGGDHAAREPWRSAAALMWEADQVWGAPADIAAVLARRAWEKRIGTHRSSAVGRLFDAAASLVLGVHRASFEGQGPMLLEAAAQGGTAETTHLPWERDAAGLLRCDWSPLLPLLIDRRRSAADRAMLFHESLAAAIADLARQLSASHSFDAIGLTGGVFQNRLLAESAVHRLAAAGHRALLPAEIPANDGGLAFGQLIEVLNGGGTKLR